MISGKNDQEPSMEDILSSIRRIIADDDDDEAPPKTSQPAAATKRGGGPQPAPDFDFDDDDDVLDLTEVVGTARPQHGSAPADDEPYDGKMDEIELEPEPEEDEPNEPEPAPPVRQPVQMKPKPGRAALERSTMVDEDMLVSRDAAAASTGALARLAKAAAGGQPAPLANGDKTVETFLVELLKPMLKEWLDSNLEGVVERVVEQEVKKLARRAELM